MNVFKNIDSLASAVADAIETYPKKLISIDGFDRVGKSYLSASLSEILNARSVELDDMWESGEPQAEDFGALKQQISEYLDNGETVIVNGVMVQGDLDKLSLCPTLKLYIKAISLNDEWVHEGWVNASDDDVKIAREGGYPIGSVYSNSVIVNTSIYHKKYQPHLNADFTLLNNHWDSA